MSPANKQQSASSVVLICIAVCAMLGHSGVVARPPNPLRHIPSEEVAQWAPDVDETLEFLRELEEQPKTPIFLPNWPYLSSLYPPSVNLDEIAGQNKFEVANGNDDEGEELPKPLALKKSQAPPRNSVRERNEKKDIHSYMNPCHFKICIMGRKRNVNFN